MKPTLVVICIATVALALGGSAAGAPSAERAAAITSYNDPAGDSGTAPDVTIVEVANDVLTGALVFWIQTPNRPTLGAGDAIVLLLNTDSNLATGEPNTGAEYAIDLRASSGGLFRWNGSDFVGSPSASLDTFYSESVKGARIEVHPNDLGGATALTFNIVTVAGESADLAPNAGGWQYAPRPERLAITVERQAITPNPPRAGRPMTVAVLFVRSDLNEFVEEGTIVCTLKVGGRALRATTRAFRGGLATCVWRLPASAKGKRVTGSVRVTFGGTTGQRAFSLKAR